MSLEALLSALRRHRGDARDLVDELREVVEREPPDEPTRRALRAELDRRGIGLPNLDAVWSPAIGEGYVLLVGALGGSVGRLAVRRGGAPYAVDGELGPHAASQAVLALDVLGRRLARRGRGMPAAGQRGHEVRVSSQVDGSSLGVSFAAAAVSRWTERPPRAEVAATAALDVEGRLVGVAGLEPKLAALADAYPAVRRVVVAAEQEPAEAAIAGITLIRCADLEQALEALGLSLDEVPEALPPASEAEREIAQLEFDQAEDYAAARWRQYALRARLLASHPGVPASKATTATAFAALFHLHAGDEPDARALVATIAESAIAELPPLGRAWVRTVQATSRIDAGQHREAAVSAAQAVELARALTAGERRDVLGRALGTLGRAKMHAGDDEAALPWLGEAADHHEAQLPRELARSLITLACGLRRAGRHDEALAALDRAAHSIEASANERASAASRRFLDYERGRALFEQGRHDEAYPCFERVMLHQPREEDYPRVGCLRYLAAIDVARGHPARARERIEQALRVAERSHPPIATIAASAGMAVVLGSAELSDLRGRAEAAWRERLSEELTDAGVQLALRRLVY